VSYVSVRATAQKLLSRKGATITVRRDAKHDRDPISGVKTPVAPTRSTFKGIGLPPGRSADKEIGSLIDRRVEEFYLSRTGPGFDPHPGDTVEGWKGRDWSIIWTTTYDPDASGAILTRCYGEA
jgi:hypothetical protein